jgi:membrane fusion protein, multidrug efflux system
MSRPLAKRDAFGKKVRMAPRSRRLLGLTFVALVLIVAGSFFGIRWWQFYESHVSTDDAYVDADVALITPRVSGTVIELPVRDNWRVERGELLARLDPTDYQVKLHAAEAALAQSEQGLNEMRAQVRSADSDVTLAEAELDLAQRDNTRVEALFAKKVVSADDLDRSRTALRVARARLAAAREQAQRARAALGIALDAPASEAPLVRRAQANRDEAALALSYTELRAPISGLVATRSVQLGQRVDSGQPLMRVVPLSRVYVEANFKETQLSDVRIGQPATIVADIYPDYEYRGVVDSLAPGTGAAFALLPPENATGNWIKVVQRVPVKIRLAGPPPADHPLRVGLSVVATVDIRHTQGPLLVPLSEKEREASNGHNAAAQPTPSHRP